MARDIDILQWQIIERTITPFEVYIRLHNLALKQPVNEFLLVTHSRQLSTSFNGLYEHAIAYGNGKSLHLLQLYKRKVPDVCRE